MTQEQQIFIATLHLVSEWAIKNDKNMFEVPNERLRVFKKDAELICKLYNSL